MYTDVRAIFFNVHRIFVENCRVLWKKIKKSGKNIWTKITNPLSLQSILKFTLNPNFIYYA